MRFFYYLVFFFYFLISFSCGKKTEQTSDNISVDNQKESENILMDFAIDTVGIVQLETKANSLISDWVDQVILTHDRILMINVAPECKISIFDKESGKFINKILAEGEGPGEFTRFSYVTYNFYNNTIEIFSSFQRKALFFDKNGSFISEKPQHLLADSKTYTSKFNCVYTCNTSSNSEFSGMHNSHRIVIQDLKTNQYNYFYPISNKELSMVHLMTPYNFYTFGKQLIWHENFNPSILSISNDQVSEKYNIEFQKNQMTSSFLEKSSEHSSMVEIFTENKIPFLNSFFLETEKYCVFTYEYDQSIKIAIYDKRKKNVVINTSRILCEKWKLALPVPIHMSDQSLVFLINAEDFQGLIKSHLNPSLLPKKFLDLNVKSNDNPVLVTLKIK